MKLYHGTSFKNIRKIEKEGIRPRKDKGVWEYCPSRENRVYLTNSYGPYFSFAADSRRSVIFEIDINKLDSNLMGTDEDIVAQVIGMSVKDDRDLFKITEEVELEKFDETWQIGLQNMGTCSYRGIIKPKAITRAVIIDWFSCPEWLWLSVADTSVSLVNHIFLKEEHNNLTAWLFGDSPLKSKWAKLNKEYQKRSKQRKGIQVITYL